MRNAVIALLAVALFVLAGTLGGLFTPATGGPASELDPAGAGEPNVATEAATHVAPGGPPAVVPSTSDSEALSPSEAVTAERTLAVVAAEYRSIVGPYERSERQAPDAVHARLWNLGAEMGKAIASDSNAREAACGVLQGETSKWVALALGEGFNGVDDEPALRRFVAALERNPSLEIRVAAAQGVLRSREDRPAIHECVVRWVIERPPNAKPEHSAVNMVDELQRRHFSAALLGTLAEIAGRLTEAPGERRWAMLALSKATNSLGPVQLGAARAIVAEQEGDRRLQLLAARLLDRSPKPEDQALAKRWREARAK